MKFYSLDNPLLMGDPIVHCSKLWIRTDYDKLKKI